MKIVILQDAVKEEESKNQSENPTTLVSEEKNVENTGLNGDSNESACDVKMSQVI